MLANQLEVEKEGRDEVYFRFQLRLDAVVCGREVPAFQIIVQMDMAHDCRSKRIPRITNSGANLSRRTFVDIKPAQFSARIEYTRSTRNIANPSPPSPIKKTPNTQITSPLLISKTTVPTSSARFKHYIKHRHSTTEIDDPLLSRLFPDSMPNRNHLHTCRVDLKALWDKKRAEKARKRALESVSESIPDTPQGPVTDVAMADVGEMWPLVTKRKWSSIKRSGMRAKHMENQNRRLRDRIAPGPRVLKPQNKQGARLTPTGRARVNVEGLLTLELSNLKVGGDRGSS